MVLQTKYRKTPPHVVSYDYTDVATGLGYQIFYLNRSVSSGATGYFLIDSNVPADDRDDIDQATHGSTFLINSSVFNSPRIIKGDAYLYSYITGGAGIRIIEASLWRVNSQGTAIQLIPGQASTIAPSNNYSCVKLSVSSGALIQKGEQLRLKLFINTNTNMEIGSAGANFPAQLHVPFKILD